MWDMESWDSNREENKIKLIGTIAFAVNPCCKKNPKVPLDWEHRKESYLTSTGLSLYLREDIS